MASVAAPDAPTVQALLAEQDAELVKAVVAWNKGAFGLPDDMVLDPSLRAAVSPLVQELLARLRTLIPTWIAEERAAAKDPNLRGARLAQALYLRSINEIAIGSVESVGPAYDEAWLKAALAPSACRYLFPTYFARRIAMIQRAPMDVRATLLAAEKELLARWGTARQGLPPRPAAAELVAANQAVTRLRESLPVTAVPMTPFLAGQVFARDRKVGKPDRWEQCATSQWWLQSQLAEPNADRRQALVVYLYSTMPDPDDFVPEADNSNSGPTRSADGKPSYPRSARYFQAEGATTLKVSLNDQGHVIKAEVVSRDLQVPGVRNNRPVAFETLFDGAALEFARQRTYSAGRAREEQFVLTWTLSEDGHEDR
jgi:hypothetical protein